MASRAVPVPGPMADPGTPVAMADQAAMADPGIPAAMADQASTADPGTQAATAVRSRGRRAGQGQRRER